MGEALESLKPDQRAIVRAYVDKGSPTYSNQTQSYLKGRPHVTHDSARTRASSLFANATVKNAVQELLEEMHASYEVRLGETVGIATARATDEVETTQYDADGNVTARTVVRKPPPAIARLKALDRLREYTGEDAATKAHNRLVSEAMHKQGQALLRDARKNVRQPREAGRSELAGGDPDNSHATTTETPPQAATQSTDSASPDLPTDAATDRLDVYDKVDMRALDDTGYGYGEGEIGDGRILPSPPYTSEPETQGGLVDYERLVMSGESGVIENVGEWDE